MRHVKRVEILTGVQELPLVERALERHGIGGYMIIENVRGKGNRQLDSVDTLTGMPESRLINTTCPPERIRALVEDLRPILTRYGGACTVCDAESLIIGSHVDLRTGSIDRAEQ